MLPLDKTIALRVIRRSLAVLDAQETGELGPELRGKLSTPVGDNRRRGAKTGNPMAQQGPCTGLGSNSGQGDGLQPPRVTVNHGEEVLVAF